MFDRPRPSSALLASDAKRKARARLASGRLAPPRPPNHQAQAQALASDRLARARLTSSIKRDMKLQADLRFGFGNKSGSYKQPPKGGL
jgi:hypothetical protein